MFCLTRYGMQGGFMGFMMIFWMVLIAAVVYFLYKKYNSTGSNSEALELLRLKFAKGEITEEEYITKKNVLMKK
jgi:putative membrane protein